MDTSDVTPSEAAELVLQERRRQRETEKRKEAREAKNEVKDITLEKVSVPKWEGADEGEVDESELDRRQRALSEQLEKRQREVIRQSKQLAKVREELKALEQPIKAEIMQLREQLESANREEISLVQDVNILRKDLFEKEKALKKVRADKQDLADNLIKVMADYERRKTERLNEIADLVGAGTSTSGKVTNKQSSFTGF